MIALPEFFSSKYPSKSPKAYRMYRRAIIDTYRSNPSKVRHGLQLHSLWVIPTAAVS